MNTYRICLRLSKSKDSNTHRPEFIFDPLPTHRNRSQETARGRGRGKITNDWRFGPISVEWLDIEMSSHVEKMLASDTTSQTRKHFPSKKCLVLMAKQKSQSMGLPSPSSLKHGQRQELQSYPRE